MLHGVLQYCCVQNSVMLRSPTKSDQAFAHFIKELHPLSIRHFWMPNHKARSLYSVLGEGLCEEPRGDLLRLGFLFLEEFLFEGAKSCYISSCFMFHSCLAHFSFYNDSINYVFIMLPPPESQIKIKKA